MTVIRLLLLLLAIFIAGVVILIFHSLQTPGKIKKAQELLDSDEQQKASELVRDILKKKPDYPPARYLRALILIRQSQYLLAISELNSILSLPEFKKFFEEVEIHYHLANLYHETQQWQKEIEEYKIILTFNPNDLNANHRVGHVYFRQKNYADAREYLEKAFTADPALADCLIPLGVSSYFLGDYIAAEQYLLKSLEKNSDAHEPQFYLGLIYKSKRNYETAIGMFKNAKKDGNFFIKSLYNLGEIYAGDDMYDDAIKTLEEGLGKIQGKDEESLAYRYLLAECYEGANKITEAVHHWRKIEEMYPGYKNTDAKLAVYREILDNTNLRVIFTSSLEELQPLIAEIIARLNYNIISKKEVNLNEYMYKVFNIKRINEPPILVYFNRTTRDITEAQIADFHKKMGDENCRSGIYMSTSRFSLRAKNHAAAIMVELFDAGFLNKAVERIMTKRAKPTTG